MPPSSPARRASASSGNVSRSGARELERQPAARSSCGTSVAARSGIGQRERDRHASCPGSRGARSAAPSRKRTSDVRRSSVGCTTTSIRLVRDAEEEVRLDQLEALVGERRRVDRDLRPHAPGRVRERVLDRRRRRDRPACGRGTARPRPVRTSESTESGSRPSRHWKSAECSQSTGSSRPPPRSCAASASSPAATRLSLFASASVTPRSSAQSVAPTPGEADDRVQDDVRLGALEQLREVAADLACRRRARGELPSRSAATRTRERTSSSSGFRSTTSIACRPIEPVAPSSATRFTRQQCALRQSAMTT